MKHGIYDIWNLEIDEYKEEYISEMYDDTCIEFDYLHCEEMYPEIYGLSKKSSDLWTATVLIKCLHLSDREYFILACQQLLENFNIIESWTCSEGEYEDYSVCVIIDRDMSVYDVYYYIMSVRDKVIEATGCVRDKTLTEDTQRIIREQLPIYQRAMNKVKLELSNFITDSEDNHKKINEIVGRVKTISSIEEKVYRKNICQYNALEKFDDIAGVRCTCEYIDDVYDVLRYIEKNPLLEVVDVDDKIENSTVQGYRGIHVIVVVSVFFQEILYEKIKVEIQLRTAFQNAWSMKTHELTYKKENSDIEEIQSTMRELSEVLYEADKIALRMKHVADGNGLTR